MRKRWLAFMSAAAVSVCIAFTATQGAASAAVTTSAARLSMSSHHTDLTHAIDARLRTVTPDASSSTFNFCNNTGGKTIACFSATVTFVNSNTVTLSNIVLQDKLCDGRSVYALLYWQSGFYENGVDPNLRPYTWEDSSGCNSSVSLPNLTVSVNGGIQYAAVYLWAANDNGESSTVSSLKHDNPYF